MKAEDKERFKQLLVEANDRSARIWDRLAVPPLAQLRERVVELARLAPGDRVLDVGTATGATALLAAQRVGKSGRVLGIDTSPKMVKRAQKNAARTGLTNVDFQLMDSSFLELSDESFDAVVSCLGQPEAPWDLRPALVGWRRVLVAGGRLCLCTEPGLDEVWSTLDPVFRKYRVNQPSPRLAARRQLKSLVAKEDNLVSLSEPSNGQRVIRSAGFTEVRHLTEYFEFTIPARAQLDIQMAWGWADECAEMPPAVQDRFRREALQALRPFEVQKGGVNFFVARKPGK